MRTARRYGTRVTPLEAWNLLDGDVIAWHATDHPRMRRIFAETTELRAIMEPSAAALAARRATDDAEGDDPLRRPCHAARVG